MHGYSAGHYITVLILIKFLIQLSVNSFQFPKLQLPLLLNSEQHSLVANDVSLFATALFSN